jgi:hypothetical protein
MECTLLSWTYFAQTGMQCTNALPDFIISGNVNMINLIGAASRRMRSENTSCLMREKSQIAQSGSTPMSDGPRPLPKQSPVIVRLTIIVGFLLVLLVIVAIRRP